MFKDWEGADFCLSGMLGGAFLTPILLLVNQIGTDERTAQGVVTHKHISRGYKRSTDYLVAIRTHKDGKVRCSVSNKVFKKTVVGTKVEVDIFTGLLYDDTTYCDEFRVK